MTNIDIINAALASLGATPIVALDKLSAEARAAEAIYPVTRDALLGIRQWTFAKTRDQLVLDPQAPAFGFPYRYNLPNNVLSVIRCYQGDGQTPLDDWIREGGYVLTANAAPVYAEMMIRVPETGYHPVFIKALVAQLAADLAMPLTENRAVADSWETKAANRLIEASAADGKQGVAETHNPRPMKGRRQGSSGGGTNWGSLP